MEQLCHRLEVAVSLADYTAAVEAGEEIRMHRAQLQDALDALPAQALARTQGFSQGRQGPAGGQ
jgi:hypothetical protein